MKRPFQRPLFIVISLVMLWATACGGKKDKPADNQDSDTLSVQREEDANAYYVWVDKLRARKTPGMNGDVLMELEHGSRLIFMNERSDFKDKAILRGKEYEDHWMKVKLPDGHIGWVFGAAITQDMELVASSDDYIIRPGEGVGKIDLAGNDSYDDLVVAYGKENVEKTAVMMGEGETAQGFVIYRDTPNEIECTCCNSAGGIDAVIIRRPGGRWTTADGIKIGTPLDSLVKMNGKPIDFFGFGWDYAGQVMSYNGGKLEKYKDRMTLVLGEPESLEGLDDFMGDNTFSTKDKRILGRGVRVAEIWVTLE